MIGSVLVMVLVLVGGVLLGIQPQLAAAAVAKQQLATAAASNAGQSAVLDQLKMDFAHIDSLRADLAPLSASVPSGSRMPALINQLDTLASTTQVTLDGFTVSEAAPYTPVEAPSAAADADAASTSSSTPAPTSVAVVPTAGVPPVTNAQITSANFASLAVSVTVSGGYANALSFVSGLQSGERLFLVSGLTTSANASEAGDGDVTAVITGLVYVLVPAADQASTPAAG